jgi:hypothetical protein
MENTGHLNAGLISRTPPLIDSEAPAPYGSSQPRETRMPAKSLFDRVFLACGFHGR